MKKNNFYKFGGICSILLGVPFLYAMSQDNLEITKEIHAKLITGLSIGIAF